MSELSCDTPFIGQNETHDLSRSQTYAYSDETTLSTKICFETCVGAFLKLKLKVTKIPIQNGPFFAPRASLFSALEAIDFKGPRFYKPGTMPDRLVKMS